MNFEKYTQKAQEAIYAASEMTSELSHQAIEPLHILSALLNQQDGIAVAVITKIAGSVAVLREEVQTELENRSKVYGSNVDVGLSPCIGGFIEGGRTLCQRHGR